MTHQLTRRAALCAAPVALIPLPALSATDDPILPLYQEWRAARAEWFRHYDLPGNGNWDSPESMAAANRETRAFYAMADMTPVSMEGIALLACVLWDAEGPASLNDDVYAEECRTPKNRLIASIWRAASGQSGLPPRKVM